MILRIALVFLLILFFSISTILQAQEESLTVCAASSLTDAMTKIAAEFEVATGIKVYLNLASSNALRIQIEQGIPCDVYLSADTNNMARLINKGFVDRTNTRTLLRNSLVVITSLEKEDSLEHLSDLVDKIKDYLSLADPQTVPAGLYAREALENAGVWSKLQNKIAPAFDVRSALLQVEGHNADFGIVYKTDAAISQNVKIVYKIPQEMHSPIQYPVGLINDTEHFQSGQRFLDFLETPQIKRIFNNYGFLNYDQ